MGALGCTCSQTKSRTLRSWPALTKRSATLRGAQLCFALCKGLVAPPCKSVGAASTNGARRSSNGTQKRMTCHRSSWTAATGLGAQQLEKRKGFDASHANMMSSFDLNTTQGQRDGARLCISSGGPAGAFLPTIPGGRMTLGNDMFVVSVWHRLGHHVTADVAPPPCKCRASVAATADHAMVCEKVAKMTQMRHDKLENALRLVVSACRCQSTAAANRRSLATGPWPARRVPYPRLLLVPSKIGPFTNDPQISWTPCRSPRKLIERTHTTTGSNWTGPIRIPKKKVSFGPRGPTCIAAQCAMHNSPCTHTPTLDLPP